MRIFGASIRVVALLKQKKVPRIFARAIDAVHKAVLEAFELERILTPEEDAARSLACNCLILERIWKDSASIRIIML